MNPRMWLSKLWLRLLGLDETKLIEGSPGLMKSLKQGIEDARAGKLSKTDTKEA